MQRRCCCPPESSRPERLQLVLDLVPQGRAAERALDQLVHVAPIAVDPRTPGDVVVDALGERIRLLKDHADPAPQDDGVDVGARDQIAVKADIALHACAGDQVVHPVEASEQGALAAARWADQGGDLVARDIDRDLLDRQGRPVPDGEAAGGEHDRVAEPRWSGGGGGRRLRADQWETVIDGLVRDGEVRIASALSGVMAKSLY